MTNTGIPEQVKAQSDRADELMKGLRKEDPGTAPAPNTDNQDQKPTAEEAETVESLRHKLSVLQGKYNAEIVPLQGSVQLLNTLKNEKRTLSGQLSEANLLIKQLQKQLTERDGSQLADIPDVVDIMKSLSEEDRKILKEEGFDGKVVDIFAKMVKTVSSARQVTLLNPDDDLAAKATQIDQATTDNKKEAELAFWREFSAGVKDWEPINRSDGFNDWLDQFQRRAALTAAQRDLDSVTAIKIFNDYKVEAAALETARKPLIDPSKQVEPDSSVTHQTKPAGEAPAGKTYTRSEVAEFYKDLAIGKYTKEDGARIDADILAAYGQGRIK